MDKQDSRTAVEAEMQAGRIDPELWSRAQVIAGDDAGKQRQTYIQLRQVALRLEAEAPRPDDALTALRGEIERLCAAQGRRSHYALLGIAAAADPLAVAAACARGQARRAALPEGKLRSEIDAALQALATPAARADYDRRLHAELSTPVFEAPPPWRRPSLIAAGAVLLLVLGGMQLGGGERPAKPAAASEPQAPASEAAAKPPVATLSTAEIEAEIVRNQKLATEGAPEDRQMRLPSSSSTAMTLDQRLAHEAELSERAAQRAIDSAARQQEAVEQRADYEARQRTEAIRREGFNRAIKTRDFNHALKLASNEQEITYVEQSQRRWVEQEIASARSAEDQKAFGQAVLTARQRYVTRPY